MRKVEEQAQLRGWGLCRDMRVIRYFFTSLPYISWFFSEVESIPHGLNILRGNTKPVHTVGPNLLFDLSSYSYLYTRTTCPHLLMFFLDYINFTIKKTKNIVQRQKY
jgi:hypothetical protein